MRVTHKFVSSKLEQSDPTLVGPHEWNDDHIVIGSTLPFLVSSDFIFTLQTPGNNLVIGSNTVAMSPLPAGVVIGDKLYISGGTGTAEAVPVTGISGNNIIITCIYTHSGAWTIQSATSGIQEAINSAQLSAIPQVKAAHIYIPVGTWAIFATITLPDNSSFRISGAGQRVTFLINTGSTTFTIFALSNPQCTILEDFEIDGPGDTGSNYAIVINNGAWSSRIERVRITNEANGIRLIGTLLLNAFRDIEIDLGTTGGTAVFVNGSGGGEAGGTFDKVFIQAGATAGSKGFYIVNGVGALLRDCYANGTAIGLFIQPGPGQQVSIIDLERAYFDGYTVMTQANGYGMYISAALGGSVSFIRGVHCGCGGFLNGLVIDGTGSRDVCFINSLFAGNTDDGIYVGGTVLGATITDLSFIDCWSQDNNVAKNAINCGLDVAGVTNLIVRGGMYGASGPATNTQNFGARIDYTKNAIIDGAILTPNLVGPILVTPNNTGVVIKNCIGYNPVGQAVITVGASPLVYVNNFSALATLYITGGTVSSVVLSSGPNPVATSSPCQIRLLPNASVTITYSVAPTVIVNVE